MGVRHARWPKKNRDRLEDTALYLKEQVLALPGADHAVELFELIELHRGVSPSGNRVGGAMCRAIASLIQPTKTKSLVGLEPTASDM